VPTNPVRPSMRLDYSRRSWSVLLSAASCRVPWHAPLAAETKYVAQENTGAMIGARKRFGAALVATANVVRLCGRS
jgi:hypothetical protein